MQTNDILRRLRYALDLGDADMAEMMNHWDEPVTAEHVTNLLRAEGHDLQARCSSRELERLLDGLILARRGPRDPANPTAVAPSVGMNNNVVLKKLRIALAFKEADMLGCLEEGGLPVTASELTALFRKPDHKHYREAGDQLLRNFLKGLGMRFRVEHQHSAPPRP